MVPKPFENYRLFPPYDEENCILKEQYRRLYQQYLNLMSERDELICDLKRVRGNYNLCLTTYARQLGELNNKNDAFKKEMQEKNRLFFKRNNELNRLIVGLNDEYYYFIIVKKVFDLVYRSLA